MQDVLQAVDAENFLPRFAYGAGVFADQWKDALCRYYAGLRLSELPRFDVQEQARRFPLSWIRYLMLMDVETMVSM